MYSTDTVARIMTLKAFKILAELIMYNVDENDSLFADNLQDDKCPISYFRILQNIVLSLKSTSEEEVKEAINVSSTFSKLSKKFSYILISEIDILLTTISYGPNISKMISLLTCLYNQDDITKLVYDCLIKNFMVQPLIILKQLTKLAVKSVIIEEQYTSFLLLRILEKNYIMDSPIIRYNYSTNILTLNISYYALLEFYKLIQQKYFSLPEEHFDSIWEAYIQNENIAEFKFLILAIFYETLKKLHFGYINKENFFKNPKYIQYVFQNLNNNQNTYLRLLCAKITIFLFINHLISLNLNVNNAFIMLLSLLENIENYKLEKKLYIMTLEILYFSLDFINDVKLISTIQLSFINIISKKNIVFASLIVKVLYKTIHSGQVLFSNNLPLPEVTNFEFKTLLVLDLVYKEAGEFDHSVQKILDQCNAKELTIILIKLANNGFPYNSLVILDYFRKKFTIPHHLTPIYEFIELLCTTEHTIEKIQSCLKTNDYLDKFYKLSNSFEQLYKKSNIISFCTSLQDNFQQKYILIRIEIIQHVIFWLDHKKRIETDSKYIWYQMHKRAKELLSNYKQLYNKLFKPTIKMKFFFKLLLNIIQYYESTLKSIKSTGIANSNLVNIQEILLKKPYFIKWVEEIWFQLNNTNKLSPEEHIDRILLGIFLTSWPTPLFSYNEQDTLFMQINLFHNKTDFADKAIHIPSNTLFTFNVVGNLKSVNSLKNIQTNCIKNLTLKVIITYNDCSRVKHKDKVSTIEFNQTLNIKNNHFKSEHQILMKYSGPYTIQVKTIDIKDDKGKKIEMEYNTPNYIIIVK